MFSDNVINEVIYKFMVSKIVKTTFILSVLVIEIVTKKTAVD
jgi:hypothetical protein|tara:strand:+ start:219 stop:344 length:126 start_codon:yes stop_codon:yes gene_type:complete